MRLPCDRTTTHSRQETPLRHWLRHNLPAEKPPRVKALTWDLLQRYVIRASIRDLAAESGLSREAIESRFAIAAGRMGYQRPESVAWLLPDGRLAAHAVDRNPDTGCWVWRGYLDPDDVGPYCLLPHGYLARHPSTATPAKVNVRTFLWSQLGWAVPAGHVVAGCGEPTCVNPDHAVLRKWHDAPSERFQADLIARKEEETASQAARRVGLSVATVQKVRGPGGKRGNRSELRPWLRDHLPQVRPSDVQE